MTRVIHTADTHIGYRQYHAEERRLDFIRAFERVIDDAIDAGVDAVVHAGDLFHDKRPELADLQGTVAALARLRRADIPFLGIVGNHERKRETQWLDLFEDLGLATRLGEQPTVIGDVAFYGLDYVTPSYRDQFQLTFTPTTEATTAILVAHGIIKGFPHGDWELDSMLEASPVSFDAVLLGDYHEHEIKYIDDTVYTYSGSTERVSATETVERGYNLVDVGDTVSITHRAVPDTRRFVFTEIDLVEAEGTEHVKTRLQEYDLEDAVVIVTLQGAGEPVSPADIETHALDRGALVARVRDQREIDDDDEASIAVSFADPDRAVRQQLEQERLSDAVMQIDGIVRDMTIADSNVRDRVHERIKALLEDDPTALDVPDEPVDDARDTEPGEPVSVDASDEDTQASEAPDDQDDPADGTTEESPLRNVAGQASMEDYL